MLRFIIRFMAIAVIVAAASGAAQAKDLDALLADLSNEDAAVREAAWNELTLLGPEAVGPLTALIAGDDHTAAAGARAALKRLAHRACTPGRDSERGNLAQALLAEATGPHPAVIRCWILRLVSFTGTDECVPGLAGLLADKEVGDMALFALARIPGDASGSALREALATAPPMVKAGVIQALAARRDEAACSALIACTEDSDATVRLAAIDALGKIPSKDCLPVLTKIEARKISPENARARTALLELAATYLDASDRQAALEIYEHLLRSCPALQDRCAGLNGIVRIKGPQSAPALLDAIREGPGELAATAANALSSMKGKSITMAMAEAVATAQPAARTVLIHGLGSRSDVASTHAMQAVIVSMKSASDPVRIEILNALADLEDNGLRGAFLEASRDENEDVAVAAIDALGRLRSPASNPRLFELVRSGREKERAAALRACVRIADGIAPASKDEALAIYRDVLTLARSDGEKRTALAKLGDLGHTGAIAVIRPYARGENESLRKVAAAALFPLAEKLAKDEGEEARAEAVTLLEEVVKLADSADVVQKAATRLRELGVDVDVPLRPGVVGHFWLLGPLPGQKALRETDPVDTAGPVDVSKAVTFEGQEYAWASHPPDHIQGRINLLLAVAQAGDCGAYAYAEITVGEAMDATLKMGSDDDIFCWLNGALVHSFVGGRGWGADQDSVDVRLEAGANTILLKVLNGGGGWDASVRIIDREGKPVEFEERGP